MSIVFYLRNALKSVVTGMKSLTLVLGNIPNLDMGSAPIAFTGVDWDEGMPIGNLLPITGCWFWNMGDWPRMEAGGCNACV